MLLCASTERVTLAITKNVNRQAKNAERRNKLSIRTGKDTELEAKLVKTFRNVGDVKNDTAGL